MKLLLVNDDGYEAMGIQALMLAFPKEDIFVVAPSLEQSAKGHSFTLNDPLYVKSFANNCYHLSGTPADCTYFGLNKICPDVDVVLSGINMGANLGTDIYYSGTVAAAREGFLKGKLSFAVSVLEDVQYSNSRQREMVYAKVAHITRQLIEYLYQQHTQPALWNINFPASSMLSSDPPAIVLKPLGHRLYKTGVHEKTDPRGRTYYWIGGPPLPMEESDTDVYWCERGTVVMTPLQLDCTDYDALRNQQDWTPEVSGLT